MQCPACQHENRPQAKFCEECAGPLRGASPVTRSHADDLKAEVERLRQTLSEAGEQQKATAELLQARNRELAEANEQQTATGEILSVISGSPTDIQPVFDAIVRTAVKLCNAPFGAVIRFDGEQLHLVAQHNWTQSGIDAMRRVFPRRLDRSTFSGRAILDGTVVHVPDIEQDPERSQAGLDAAHVIGYRSTLTVPM